MERSVTRSWQIFLVVGLAALLAACGGTPTAEVGTPDQPPTATVTAAAPAPATATATATVTPAQPATTTPSPTPTALPVVLPTATVPPVASRCQGLAGNLEVQVLVGPAEAVGLEPVSVGQVPFAVTSEQPPYLVQGQGPITYEAVLEKEWGTYSVDLDQDAAISGECLGEAGSEVLNLLLEMTGEQMVVVDAEGFHGEYPWSGTNTRNLSLPLQEGATAQGEGWVVVLHLGPAP